MFEAFYDAKLAEPNNPQVIATERAGVSGVVLLLPNCKPYVLTFYRDELNSMVGYGAKTSFLGVLHENGGSRCGL